MTDNEIIHTKLMGNDRVETYWDYACSDEPSKPMIPDYSLRLQEVFGEIREQGLWESLGSFCKFEKMTYQDMENYESGIEWFLQANTDKQQLDLLAQFLTEVM